MWNFNLRRSHCLHQADISKRLVFYVQFSNGCSAFHDSPQAFWDKMCIVPTRDPSNTGCAEGTGLCVSPTLLRLHHLQPTAGHRGRVLPHGGWEAGVQGGLWDCKTKRWVCVWSSKHFIVTWNPVRKNHLLWCKLIFHPVLYNPGWIFLHQTYNR